MSDTMILPGNCHRSIGRSRVTQLVYILDDDPRVRSSLSEALVEMGFLTREFARIEELSPAFEVEMPDVAILDVSLHEPNPIDIIAWLEVVGFTGKLVLIGTEDPIQHAKVQQIGALRELAKLPYIRKPIQIEKLKATLDLIDPIEPPAVIVDLAQALRNGWLELWYQPKVDPKSLSLRGAEALIRMRHPRWGVVALPRFDAAIDESRIRLLLEFAVGRMLTDWSIFAEERMPIEIAIKMPVSILQDLAFFRFFRNHLPIHPRFPGFTCC